MSPLLLLLVFPAASEAPPSVEAGVEAFADVARVLQHPRCSNCHPTDDVPLQGDEQRPHAMLVDRHSPQRGLPCSTCHREQGLKLAGLPPANPHWQLPPANQVFVGRSPTQLCEQLNDPLTTGGRDLDALLHHVSHDSLVLWAWDPGPGRTPPPLAHAEFVERFAIWVQAGGPCP